MSRTLLLAAAAVLVVANTGRAQNTGKPKPDQTDAQKIARIRYHSAEAALYSALSHAAALESLAQEPGKLAAELALSHVKTVNRDANECNTDTVKMGLAVHSLEKSEHLKSVRSELAEAIKAADQAHNAVDGHGEVGPHIKETLSHLRKARIALDKLAGDVGTKPLPPPGSEGA